MTTTSTITLTRTVRIQIFWHTYYLDYRPSTGVFIFYFTYLVQLFYFEKLSRPKYHEFSLKLLIFQCYNTKILNVKLSLYYIYILIRQKGCSNK